MPSFTVFKGHESGAPKKETTTRPDDLWGDEVFVRITASGVCGTGKTDQIYKQWNSMLITRRQICTM